MPDDPTAVDTAAVERAVVVQLFDRPGAMTRDELHAAIAHPAAAIDAAVEALEGVGVLRTSNGDVRASDAVRCLDRLGLICV